MHSVTLLICLCGMAGNGAVLCLVSLNDIALLIFSLVVADFLFLLFAVPSTLLFLLEDVSCSPIMSPVYVSFIFGLFVVSCYWGLFWLIIKSIFFCNFCCCDLPKRLRWMLLFALFWAFFTVIIFIPTVSFLCPSQEQEHCRGTLISINSITLLLFAAPVIIFSTIYFIIATCICPKQKQQLKRLIIIIFLMVVFTLLFNLCNFLQQFGYINVSSQVVFLLACINSSIKPFIYFSVGSFWRPCSVARCWTHCTVGSLRASLRRVFEEPEENNPSSNDGHHDLSLLIPSPALLKDPRNVAEAFLEPPD